MLKDTNKVAVVVVQNKEGKYLLITRSEYLDHKGEWGPIAGHLKEGESVEHALIRESKEELDLVIKPIKQMAVLPQDIPGDTGYWWICIPISGDITPNEEVEEYKYFSLDEIKNLKLWPATKKFFEEFVWLDTHPK